MAIADEDIVSLCQDFSGISKYHEIDSLYEIIGYLSAIGRIDHQDYLGNTVLHIASHYAVTKKNNTMYSDLVKYLLSNGADVNIENYSGRTVLRNAAEGFVSESDEDVVNILLKMGGADPNTQDKLGIAPIHFAASVNNSNIIEILLGFGADIEISDVFGGTPLHWAVSENSIDSIKLLLSKKANINACNRALKTPLHVASLEGALDSVKLLLSSGAGKDMQDITGNTPLHYAVERGNSEIVQLLLDYGANPNLKDEYNKAPIDYSINRNIYNLCVSYQKKWSGIMHNTMSYQLL